MLYSEYEGWREYFDTQPSIQEIQMANLIFIQAAKGGMKDITMNDFMVTKKVDVSRDGSDIHNASVDEINELLEV